tara:strand:- start:2666 stop:3079 length:414 start_codon:yes stop_codon:yes gene_type:complete
MQVPMEHLMILAHPNADKLRKKGIIDEEEFEEFFEAFHSAVEVWLDVLRGEIGATDTFLAEWHIDIFQMKELMHLIMHSDEPEEVLPAQNLLRDSVDSVEKMCRDAGRCFKSPTLIAKFYDNIAQRVRMTCMHLGVW